jgi:DNA-binding CsgD family transcriptional regulator
VKASASTLQNYFDLTEREMDIVQLLAKALSYKEIGEQLNISVNTAKKHVIKIYEKLHVNTRAQALKLMYDKKLL